MGRRRRRVIRVFRRTLPKVYSCPRCGVVAVKVKPGGSSPIVTCGSCGLTPPPSYKPTKTEPIDIYNEFVDMYMAGKVSA